MAINIVVFLVSNQKNDKREGNVSPARADVTTRITTHANKTAVLVRNECHLTDPAPFFSWKITPHCRMLQFSLRGSYRAGRQFSLHGSYRAGWQFSLHRSYRAGRQFSLNGATEQAGISLSTGATEQAGISLSTGAT
jgi:hypothetical protein